MSESGEIQPEAVISLEKRYQKAADDTTRLLTPERIKTLLPTEDLQRAFERLATATMTMYNLATLEKKRAVLEMRERGFLDEGLLRRFPAVYEASGTDIEYPILLGGRNIIMVDPFTLRETGRQRVEDVITALAQGRAEKMNDYSFSFPFDFGSGEEHVTIRLDPRAYADEGAPSAAFERDQVERFVSPAETAMLLAFQGSDIGADTKSVESLIPGGLVVSNRMIERFFSEYMDESEANRERWVSASEEGKRGILDEIYKTHGFEPLDVSFTKHDTSWTVLRKSKA